MCGIPDEEIGRRSTALLLLCVSFGKSGTERPAQDESWMNPAPLGPQHKNYLFAARGFAVFIYW